MGWPYAWPPRVMVDADGNAYTASNPIPTSSTASGDAGSSNHRLLSAAASVNATVVKASAGRVFKLMGKNARASDVFLKLYNKATAPDENDTPIHTIALPGSSYFDLDLGGFSFTAGISYRMTTAGADNSTAALTAADIVAFNLSYT